MIRTTLVAMLLSGALGCTSLLGLEVMEDLPASFPLEVGAPTGEITHIEGGPVAVDLVFEGQEEARSHWVALRAQAEADGWRVVSEGRKGKRDSVVLESKKGRLELGCCLQRADRMHLVFVSWWSDISR